MVRGGVRLGLGFWGKIRVWMTVFLRVADKARVRVRVRVRAYLPAGPGRPTG